jgi:hypothetical protein
VGGCVPTGITKSSWGRPAENCNIQNGRQESTTRKQPWALNLRSHSLDKLRQIVTTGAFSISETDC